jgi:hypothetical protein
MLVGLRVSLYQLQTLQVHSPVALDFFKPTAFPFVFRAARLPSALSNAAQVELGLGLGVGQEVILSVCCVSGTQISVRCHPGSTVTLGLELLY